MVRRNSPAVDRSIVPASGVTRDGQPLSYNRAPASDLASWIARLYVTNIDLPPGYTIDCGLFIDTTCVNLLLGGDWHAGGENDAKVCGSTVMFFGPQSKRMPVSITGSFVSIGMQLRAGVSAALNGVVMRDHLDRVVDNTKVSQSDLILPRFTSHADPEEWIGWMENAMRRAIARAGGAEPDPISAQFEMLAFTDPSIRTADFAADCGIGTRTLERIVKRDFGLTPKQVLRRARALDFASHLRGVADADEAEELALRYCDQSHQIREFTQMFGMRPRDFVLTPQPLLTLGLEARQARRLEMLDRLVPGSIRPWQ